MCLESNLQIYLFIGFVLLGIIYLTILKLKHIRKKKFNIRLLFTIIILLIIYILLFGMIKKCDDKNNEYKKIGYNYYLLKPIKKENLSDILDEYIK